MENYLLVNNPNGEKVIGNIKRYTDCYCTIRSPRSFIAIAAMTSVSRSVTRTLFIYSQNHVCTRAMLLCMAYILRKCTGIYIFAYHLLHKYVGFYLAVHFTFAYVVI